MRARMFVALAVLAGLIGCNSPEAARSRGGGGGADVGNRARVELHGGSKIYHKTPVIIPERARGDAAPAGGSARPSG
jgi:hypothetical protein